MVELWHVWVHTEIVGTRFHIIIGVTLITSLKSQNKYRAAKTDWASCDTHKILSNCKMERENQQVYLYSLEVSINTAGNTGVMVYTWISQGNYLGWRTTLHLWLETDLSSLTKTFKDMLQCEKLFNHYWPKSINGITKTWMSGFWSKALA